MLQVSQIKNPPNFRTGFGVDIHQLVEGIPLVIGGIEIPSDLGALGHSDADVLLHAICDALLGALTLGDIGTHFPDADPTFKGIDSKILLQKSYKKVQEFGYKLNNLDATVLLESPELALHIPLMQEVISELLLSEMSQVSIKATRGEKLGFVGERKGIKAYCNLLLVKV